MGIVKFHHLRGVFNPADMLSKHWAYQATWPQLRPLMFYKGDTADIEFHEPTKKGTKEKTD